MDYASYPVVIVSRSEPNGKESTDNKINKKRSLQNQQAQVSKNAKQDKINLNQTDSATVVSTSILSSITEGKESKGGGERQDNADNIAKKQEKKRARHARIFREKFGDYYGLKQDETGNSMNGKNEKGAGQREETGQIIEEAHEEAQEAIRRRGCVHWKDGCGWEGAENEINNHLDVCCFENMKLLIRKRDNQILRLENDVCVLKEQVRQLHSIITSMVSMNTPRLRSHLIAQLPNDVTPLTLERNISNELYEPSNPIDITLNSLHESLIDHAMSRREAHGPSLV